MVFNISWDKQGDRFYETGIDRGVLYPQNDSGIYPEGVPWNGLIEVSENPTGAEPTPLHADNIKYLELMSVEEFEASIEAYTYPKEFEACDGSAELAPGVTLGQQSRRPFGMSYRTKIGNDIDYDKHGYKIHLIYGAMASPTDKGYQTISDTPEAIQFSWDITTTPVAVTGFEPTATLTINSTEVGIDVMETLEGILYGEGSTKGRLPLPDEILTIITGVVPKIEVTPPAPTFSDSTGIITIPDEEGVIYKVGGETASSGAQEPIAEDTDVIVTAEADTGYRIKAGVTTTWTFNWSS